MNRFRQWWCQMRRGHEFCYQTANRRLYLVCLQCGKETPGWTCATTIEG